MRNAGYIYTPCNFSLLYNTFVNSLLTNEVFLIKIQNREFIDVVKELADKFGIELPKKYKTSSDSKSQKTEMIKAVYDFLEI